VAPAEAGAQGQPPVAPALGSRSRGNDGAGSQSKNGMEIAFHQLLIQTINGVVTGMILALVASGLTLIFGIMDVVNFAHGELFMLGAYVGVIVLAATGDFWLALAAASLIIAVLGAAIYLTTLRRLLGRDPLTTLLSTFGVSLVLQNYALWQFGPVARKIQEPFTGHFTLFYLDYPWYRLVIALISAGIIGALWLFLKYGTFGIWIRATTQDRVMAQAMGIPVPLVLMTVFAIGAAMAGASGVLFGPLTGVNPTMGLDWILRALIVVVVGGMGNLAGSVAAAILISLLEAYASLWVSPAQAVIVSFVVLILTLLFRPSGLFVATAK
jgi:branched-chain amino acid transport system permease protein